MCAKTNSSHSFFIKWLLCRTTFLQRITPCAKRSPLLCWICTGGWERPPSEELCEEEREENQQAFIFFSAYETNVWHSTEHCSAVGLSVNRRQYARACWRLIWHRLPRNFQKQRGTVHLASPVVILLRDSAAVYSLSHLQPINRGA